MPKAKKLPSGSWHIQGYYKDAAGKVHRPPFTAPTKVEVELMYAEFMANKKDAAPAPKLTVGQAVDRYISLSAPVLSPSTIHRYELMRAHSFPDLMAFDVSKLSDESMQLAINAESRRISKGKALSPKTVANEYGLISSALKTVCGLSFNVKLPKRQRGNFSELPDPAEVMAAVRGSEIELPVMLALWLSFSMSEVLGLMASDVNGDIIAINRVRIYLGGEMVEKTDAKVDTRKRAHRLPPYLISLINNTEAAKKYAETGENGPLVALPDYKIRYELNKCLEEAGVRRVTFHQLRHMNASVMLALNVPDKYAMERGGWKTDHTMKSVYQHTFSAERLKVDAAVNAYFEQKLHTITHTDAVKR